MPESYAGKINRKLLKKQRIIAAAAGREPADLVLKNATYGLSDMFDWLCTFSDGDVEQYFKLMKPGKFGEMPWAMASGFLAGGYAADALK